MSPIALPGKKGLVVGIANASSACAPKEDLHARVLGLETPRVAVLSAVGTVTPKLPSTLLAPDLDAGNILLKQLGYLAQAEGAGIVLGARIRLS